MSTSSLEQRLQVTFSIPGVEEHGDKTLKTFIQTFMWERGIGCCVERVAHASSYSTNVLFESTAGNVYSSQKELFSSLNTHFPNIDIPIVDNWIISSSVCALTAAKIKSTASNLLRTDSSGVNSLQKELQDFDDSVSLSLSIRRAMKAIPGINWASRALQASGKLQQRVVYVHYKNRTIAVDVTMSSWESFIDELCVDKILNLPCRVKQVYSKLLDGSFGVVQQIEHLKDERHYYVTILDDENIDSTPATSSSPTFSTMEEFYKALKDLGVDPNAITTIIIPAFQNNFVLPSQLSNLTDEKLKEDGIVQRGLREAILKVIGKSV